MSDDLRDRLAEQAWGVLVAAQRDGVTDLNVIAHAIAGNVLPTVRAIAAEELEAEAAYDDAAPDEQYARYLFANRLRVRAANLRAGALDSPSPSRL